VADLACLGHRQELEAVERFRVLPEIGRHHLGRLRLRLARLLEDRGLLAVELAGHVRAALFGLAGLRMHPLERALQRRVLRQARHLVGRGLCRHGQTQHLRELFLHHSQLSHRVSSWGSS
jgi:hypothetical protein